MATPTLERIEAAIGELSLSEQLWLMERLARRIRSHALPQPVVPESELIAMAADPAIQTELRQIQAEFLATESDGLSSGP